MARKKVNFLQEVSVLLKLSVFLAKLKKPKLPKLASLKKARTFKKLRVFKSYSHYNYVKDYEFSPSNTPLIQFYRKPKSERISLKKVRSHFIVLSKCFGFGEGEGRNGRYCREMGLEGLPYGCENAVTRELTVTRSLTECSGFEEETVDERAERFIQKFYEEMRRQRHETHSQIKTILDV